MKANQRALRAYFSPKRRGQNRTTASSMDMLPKSKVEAPPNSIRLQSNVQPEVLETQTKRCCDFKVFFIKTGCYSKLIK